MTLDEYLIGKNKRAFGRAIGLAEPSNIYGYLRGRDGGAPRKRFSRKFAQRVVAETGGAVTFNELYGLAAAAAEAA